MATFPDGFLLEGCYVWSLLDDVEWAEGYARRIGIVRVDLDTLERTVKDPGRFGRDTIATNGGEL